jgi:hypothetical protein
MIWKIIMSLTNRLRQYFSPNGHLIIPVPGAEGIPATSLEEKQALLAHLVRLVARGISHGLFVAGPGGLGKSRTIQATLAAEGVCPVLINSHITPLALYKTLHHNRRDKVIWLDDCDAIYTSLPVLGLLRSALWGQGERIVTYNSSQLDDIPSRFVFESRIIFCANSIPKRNEAFKAVLSRVDVFTLEATNDELLELMRSLAARGFGSLSAAQCLEVVAFIESCGSARQLSMRLYEPSLRKVEYAKRAGIDWRDLVRCQLDQLGKQQDLATAANSKEMDFAVMAKALVAHPDSVAEQEGFWCNTRQKSRASFFRCKKAFEEQQAKQDDSPPPSEPTPDDPTPGNFKIDE